MVSVVVDATKKQGTAARAAVAKQLEWMLTGVQSVRGTVANLQTRHGRYAMAVTVAAVLIVWMAFLIAYVRATAIVGRLLAHVNVVLLQEDHQVTAFLRKQLRASAKVSVELFKRAMAMLEAYDQQRLSGVVRSFLDDVVVAVDDRRKAAGSASDISSSKLD